MKTQNIAILFLMLVAVTISGCAVGEVAAKKDQIKQAGPSQDENLLSGATVRAEGTSSVKVTRQGIEIIGTENAPAKTEIAFDKMTNKSKDEGSMEMTNETIMFNLIRAFGMSPAQVLAGNQGLNASNTPFGDFWGGQQKGYGIAERAWDWLKQAFWILVIAAVVIAVVCIYPPTRFIGIWILRALSYIPFLGTILAPILDWLDGKDKDSLIFGVENFKAALTKTSLSATQIEEIKDLLRTEQAKLQSNILSAKIDKVTA